MRFWLGLSFLSGSWLFGLDYFARANPAGWAVCAALGVLLVGTSLIPAVRAAPGELQPRSSKTPCILLALACIPGLVLLPFPYRLAPALLMAGALIQLLSARGRWLRVVAGGTTLAGGILLAQSLAMAAYRQFTARSHELPWPLPQCLAAIARFLGSSAAADGSDLVLSTMRHNHRLGATWDLFLDPAAACFLVGGIFAVWLSTRGPIGPAPPSKAKRNAGKPALVSVGAGQAIRATLLLLLAAALWLPLQAGLNIGLFLHRALRTDFEAGLNLMNQFWSPWPHLFLLMPLALLAAWWTRGMSFPSLPLLPTPAAARDRRSFGALGLGAASAAVFTLAVLWDPVGSPKAGRIGVDEFHSRWEPTGRPFDTEWYGHLSGYNYACLYDYCSRYYSMSRLTNSLTDAGLANLDVLILKVPTEPFQAAEVDAIARYVERGGGVLFVGEHTDVFNTGYHLNQVSRRFGFTFRYDCLFGMETFFDQSYSTPRLRHPALQNLDGFDFATSCSIDPGFSAGRGVLVSTGLKNSMADYHANNYYPQAVDHAAMRYGAFVQIWATRKGAGRVLAFTDSTIFSNFSTFEPGKIELLLGMLGWLNRRDGIGNPRPLLVLLGLALLAGAGFLAWKQPFLRWGIVAAATLSWGLTALGLNAYQAGVLPVPKAVRPLTQVTLDRTVCDGPLSKGGFIAGKPDGFGIFERWILRLGYFIRRAEGAPALKGDLVVFPYPTRPVTPEFQRALKHYVSDGGKVLILDSPKNQKSTAASLLDLFQLGSLPLAVTNAALKGPAAWPAVPIEDALEITGGTPLFRITGKPVGAMARHGKGTVVALGFGSRFSDPQMGVTGDVEPDPELRKVFDLQFALLRAIVENKLEGMGPASNP